MRVWACTVSNTCFHDSCCCLFCARSLRKAAVNSEPSMGRSHTAEYSPRCDDVMSMNPRTLSSKESNSGLVCAGRSNFMCANTAGAGTRL